MTRGKSGACVSRRAPKVWAVNGLFAGVFFLITSVAWVTLYKTAVAQDIAVNSVTIEGNQRIGDAAILTRAGIVPGQSITAGQLNAGVQELQSSGLFESVDITPSGNGLVITVVERPTINRINFEGNRRINDEILAETIGSNERRVFNPAQAEQDAANIAAAYAAQGRVAARVTPTIIRREDNRVDLIFEIFEGDNIEIERISFSGNRVFSDRRLRRVLETKQAGLFRTFIRADTLVADRIDFDRQVLRDFYFSRGYVDFQVNSVNAELTEERDAYFLVFDVQEGQQFRIGDVSVVSDVPEANADFYMTIARTRPNEVYSPTLLETDIARMERQAVIDGVDFLRVEPRITRNERDLTIDVEYALVRGPRVFVERIDIEGNTTTLDRVIRRQFDSVEGDPFNPREIRQSAERIRALGFFSNAQVNAREGSAPDLVVVDVDVEEQATGSLSFGASFSTNDGLGFALQFRERNFLGRGQELGLSFSTAADDQLYQFDFTEPAFLGRNVAFGIRLDISETENSSVSYDTQRGLFSPSLTFPVGLNSTLAVNYTYEESEMQRRDDTDNGPVIAREIAAGDLVNSSLGYKYTFDSRRSGVDPTSGYLFEFGQDFAGVGGDNTFVR
ncbi:MAG: outer membrane protein assembly factor BamA, partial [Pseudomonadota bacterium]